MASPDRRATLSGAPAAGALEGIAATAATLIAELLASRPVQGPLTSETTLRELGIDSMGVLRLILTCEERFGVELADLEDRVPPLDQIRTVGDVEQLTATFVALRAPRG